MDFVASQTAFAETLLDPGRAMPPGITCARGTANAARFAVYRNNIHVGLTAALAKRFRVVRRLVGEEFFAGMARVYAGLHKPAMPLLFEYGDSFPDFIEQFEPAQGLAYLADVARVEAAWTKAYHAEDAEPLAVAQLANLGAHDLHRTRLSPHPAASLLSSAFPAGSIWAAHQREPVASVSMWQSETVFVVRPAMDVGIHILPPEGIAFAKALFAGESLAAAAERAGTLGAGFDFGTALVGLVSLGTFTAIAEEEQPS